MNIKCLFGHTCSTGQSNARLSYGRCDACERTVVRQYGGRWYALPHGYILVSSPSGEHAIEPEELLTIARRKAPILHRLRRKTHSYGGYFSSDRPAKEDRAWIGLL